MKSSSIADELLRPGVLRTFFQPIRRVADGRTVAFEALTRGPSGSSMACASVLFEYVRLKGMEVAFDRRCVGAAAAAAGQLERDAILSVNVHAGTLARDAGFVDYLFAVAEESALSPERVVVEVVERAPIHSGPGLLAAVERLRARGAKVALDDFGSGQANFRLLVELRPELLKIDRHLIEGCHVDPTRTAVLKSIVGLAGAIGARTVAEGVERPAELLAMETLGMDWAQGYLLGEPVEAGCARDRARSGAGVTGEGAGR